MFKTKITAWGFDQKHQKFEKRKKSQIGNRATASALGSKRAPVGTGDGVEELEEAVPGRKRTRFTLRACGRPANAAVPYARTTNRLGTLYQCPTTPTHLLVPEILLKCIHRYMVGSFESGAWCSADDSKLWTSNGSLETSSRPFGTFLEFSDMIYRFDKEAHLDDELLVARSRMEHVARAEHPDTLRRLFEVVIGLNRAGRPWGVAKLLRDFLEAARKIHTWHHPLCQILRLFLSADNAFDRLLFHATVRIARLSLNDATEGILGSSHFTTKIYRLGSLIEKSITSNDARSLLMTLSRDDDPRPPIWTRISYPETTARLYFIGFRGIAGRNRASSNIVEEQAFH